MNPTQPNPATLTAGRVLNEREIMTRMDIDRIKAYLDGRSRNVFHCIHQFNEDGPADLTAAIVEIERLRAEIELSKRSNEQALWEAQSKLQ